MVSTLEIIFVTWPFQMRRVPQKDSNFRDGALQTSTGVWKYKPSNLENRFIAQQSVFVFGQWTVEKQLHEITIDKNSKQPIRVELKKSFAITEEHLFGDFTGFALSNAHDKTLKYSTYTANDYFEMGIMLQQRKDYRKAVENYDKALELDPKYIEVYYNRGVTKIELEDHQGAIEDFNKVLELDPKYLTVEAQVAHAYIGIAKEALGDIPGKIEEFKKTMAFLNKTIAEFEKN